MTKTNKPDTNHEVISQLAEAMSAIGEGGNIAAEEQDKRPVRNRALKLLSHRARSESELRGRLLEAEYPEAIIEEVISDLTVSGLLNDAEFASEWVRQRRKRRGKSRAVLAQELTAKGVARIHIDAALADVTSDEEYALAQDVADSRTKLIKELPGNRAERDKNFRRVASALARRGFNEGLCKAVARASLDRRYQELAG